MKETYETETEDYLYNTHYIPLSNIVQKILIAMPSKNYKLVLQQTSKMLSHLSPNSSCPELPSNYFKIYSSIIEQMHYIHNFFNQHPNLPYLYTSIHQTHLLIPRIYLQITIGSLLINKYPHKCYSILNELFTQVKTVNHPIRGLFLRYYLLTFIHSVLPDVGNKYENSLSTYNDSLVLLIENIEQMITLWIRISNDNEAAINMKLEHEREETKQVIIDAFIKVGSLKGTTIDIYQREIIPKTISLIMLNVDVLTQQILIESLISSFKEEYNIYSLNVFFELETFINPQVNKRKIFILLFDKLTKYINNKENGSQSKINALEYIPTHFDKINSIVSDIVNKTLNNERLVEQTISQLIELQFAFIKLTLSNNVLSDTKYSTLKETTINNIISLSTTIVSNYKQKLPKTTMKVLFRILSFPIDNNICIFNIPSYEILMTHIEDYNKHLLSLKSAEWLAMYTYDINTIDKLKHVELILTPLLYSNDPSNLDFAYEQNVLVKFIYKIHTEKSELMYEMYLYLYDMFIKGGESRYKYMMFTFINLIISFCIKIHNNVYIDVSDDNKKIQLINDNIELINKILTVTEMNYTLLSIKTCLMVHKQLFHMKYYNEHAISFLNKAIELYKKCYSSDYKMKEVFQHIVLVVCGDCEMKYINEGEYENVLKKINEIVESIKDNKKEKVFHLVVMWYLFIKRKEFDKVKESVNEVKNDIEGLEKDVELFWVVNKIVKGCLYVNGIKEIEIEKDVIVEFIKIMEEIVVKEDVKSENELKCVVERYNNYLK